MKWICWRLQCHRCWPSAMLLNDLRSKPNLCSSGTSFKPQSFQSCWEDAPCTLLQLKSIVCFISYLPHVIFKELYLLTGYISRARVVGHLSIISCILGTRKRKDAVSSEVKADQRNREDLWTSCYSSYSLQVFWEFLTWLAWQRLLRTVQKLLKTKAVYTPRGLWVI